MTLCNGSELDCLTSDQGVSGSSLTGGTVQHFILYFLLVQPRTSFHMTEKLLTGMNSSTL